MTEKGGHFEFFGDCFYEEDEDGEVLEIAGELSVSRNDSYEVRQENGEVAFVWLSIDSNIEGSNDGSMWLSRERTKELVKHLNELLEKGA